MAHKVVPIVILDFGSQYTHLIARRVRECKVYCEVFPYFEPIENILAKEPKGIILSGGPYSVYQEGAPLVERSLFSLGIPILGICYGLQLMAHLLGGRVARAQKREYGRAELVHSDPQGLFHCVEQNLPVWMSHGDKVEKLPEGFVPIAFTANSPFAAVKAVSDGKALYGLQFHPEVIHTHQGKNILENFLFRICGLSPSWELSDFIEDAIRLIKEQVGQDGNVICGLSGGVDSSVTALLLHRAIGPRLRCVFVDNGLLRVGDTERVKRVFEETLHIPITCVDARERFLAALRGVEDPEEKRRRIGWEFIKVFEEIALEMGGEVFLAQGTLYPDVIESMPVKGPSATIKTHHNVGGLPPEMKLPLIEPLRELFKDEVREVGRRLGLPEEVLFGHPFPGPGLAVRIIGEVTQERLETLRKADLIVTEELKRAELYDSLWQAFAILIPIRTTGVMGDERTYQNLIALRAVTSQDAMTADWFPMPHEVLAQISSRIVNEVPGVNRVVYDITSKPPSTIEWE